MLDSGPEPLPRKNRRIVKRSTEADISSGLRDHITQAARNIRRAHKAELAAVLKADSASRLFRSIIGPNTKPVGSLEERPGVSREGLRALAGELGGLLSDAMRAGTGLLAEPLAGLAQEWMGTPMSAAKPSLGVPSAEGPVPEETSQLPPSASPQIPSASGESAVPAGRVSETPHPSPEEVKLRGVLRQFMPMLVSALGRGGDGYGLATTVITLFGRPTYDQTCSLGKAKIMQVVKEEPDLWAQVAPIEAKFNKFLDEFAGYDAWIRDQSLG